MIRVHKTTGFLCNNREKTTKQILLDQHDKCYLCERICSTDFEIEHHHSQVNYPEDTNVWDNLFLSCSYCNGKKHHYFDGILHPSSENIEDLIEHQNDFLDKKVIFTPLTNSDAVRQTSELLLRIFNGTEQGLRKIREERFYEYFLLKINHFLSLVSAYLDGELNKHNAIIDELAIDNEFLGFKYWIIKDNPRLYNDFGIHTIFNKS